MAAVVLSEFIAWVLRRSRDNSQGTLVETANSLIRSNGAWNFLILDRPLRGQAEEAIFHVLVSSPAFLNIGVREEMEASSITPLLQKIVSTPMPNFHSIAISGNSLSAVEGKEIFSILGKSDTLQALGMSFGRSDDDVAKVVGQYIRDSSSLKALALSLCRTTDGSLTSITETAFQFIGDSLCESSSSLVRELFITQSPNEVMIVLSAAETLAQSASKSKCLLRIRIRRDTMSSVFADYLNRALLRTEAVQNMELCFSMVDNGASETIFTLCRQCPFRLCLPQNIPLTLWPRILANANSWNQQTSHSSLDAIFFLVKEKNDELLQNAKLRRIRKRKHFAISE